MRPYWVLLAAAPCLATTSVSVSPVEVTPTQAIVRISTDQAGNCTYRVSEGNVFNSPVNDVNPTLFRGSDSDSRFGSLVDGGNHVFIAGTRTAARAADGRYYSRSLQANTMHWVGVTCGSDAEVSTTFTTQNPPAGNAAPDPMPFDSTAFGNVAVPSINWADKSVPYNDPLTGFQLVRATGPEDNGFLVYNQPFATGLDLTGHWQHPEAASAGGAQQMAVCDTAASCNGDPLFVALPNFSFFYRSTGGWAPGLGITDMLARAWGSGTAATPAGRTISVCWSIDSGHTCATAAQDIVLPLTAGYAGSAPPSWWKAQPVATLTNITVASGIATVNLTAPHGLFTGGSIVVNGVRNTSVQTGVGGNGLNGIHAIVSVPNPNSLTFLTNAADGTYTDSELSVSTGFPRGQWMSWGVAPARADVGIWGGTANVTGNVMTPVDGELNYSSHLFNINWTAGTRIYIAGSAPACANNYCTIASVQNARSLSLLEQVGTLQQAQWQSASSGLRVVKKTNDGAVSANFTFDYAISSSWDSGLDGSGDVCNFNAVTVSVDKDGNPAPSQTGYLCTFPASAADQNANNIFLFIPGTGETRLIAHQWFQGNYMNWIGWHPSDGRSWYTHRPNSSIYKTTYTGDFREFRPGYIQASVEAPVPEQVTFTDAFAGSDLVTQIRNCAANQTCDAPINESVFKLPGDPPQTGSSLNGGYLILCGTTGAGGHDVPGFVVRVDMSQTPAQVVRVSYTFDKFPVGYGGIHSCLATGAKSWNVVGLNAQLGQAYGRFQGPHELLIKQVDKGQGWVSDNTGNCGDGGIGNHCDTSLTENDGFECPAGLDPKWQALGAKPIAQGGLPLCLKYKVAGEPCSAHAYDSVESTNFPCPWNSSPNYSLLKPIGEGDTIHDASYGFVSWGEYQVVVQKTANALQDIDLLVFRYRLNPATYFTCGENYIVEARHKNGWTGHMAPFFACGGGTYWQDAMDPTRSWYAEQNDLGGIHGDIGPGSAPDTYSMVVSSYLVRPNQRIPDQIGRPANYEVNWDPAFDGAGNADVFLQSYPSKRQQPGLTPPAEMNWFLDTRHYNPGFSCGGEACRLRLFDNVETNIAGTQYDPNNSTSRVWKISLPTVERADVKRLGFSGWAGWHMLGNISGPGSLITDADLYKYCYAYAAGECRPGSAAGDIFISVPFGMGQCYVNFYSENFPCLTVTYPYGSWNTQTDLSKPDPVGVSIRRLTTGFVGPGRQYNFTNSKPSPDGKWVLVMGHWLEGQRTDLFWVKLTPWNPGTGAPSTYYSITRRLNAPPNATSVRARFGYMENEPAGSTTFHYFGTSRADATTTEKPPNANDPFSFLSETGRVAQSCPRLCTLSIPAIPGRVVYYVIDWLDASGNLVTSDDPRAGVGVFGTPQRGRH